MVPSMMLPAKAGGKLAFGYGGLEGPNPLIKVERPVRRTSR